MAPGVRDETEASLTLFHRQLEKVGVKSVLKVYPNLLHAYPDDMAEVLGLLNRD